MNKKIKKSQKQIAEHCDAVKALLLQKNKKYGNSALKPIRIFSKLSPVEGINVRADDKLSRIARGIGHEDEDVVQDLIGYLVLRRIAMLTGGKKKWKIKKKKRLELNS